MEPNFHVLSPLDGRYKDNCNLVAECFSDYTLTRQRLSLEVGWLNVLIATPGIVEDRNLDEEQQVVGALYNIVHNFDYTEYEAVKRIEATTKHDVKAVEMYLRQEIIDNHQPLVPYLELIHFGLTSEDINSLAYARMVKLGIRVYIDAYLIPVIKSLDILRVETSDIPMLAHTHGQTASPTTLGKELAVFGARLERQLSRLRQIRSEEIQAKWSGAVGNYNAHYAAYPEIAWNELCAKFITECGVHPNHITTQIEPHDCLAMVFDTMAAINNIMVDLSVDMWLYISKGYFGQHIVEGEVGSSTMPHKVNPINFENAEGNLGVATALFRHFSDKLTKSRLQRDLSDSTVLRSVGVAFGYSAVSCESLAKGLDKVVVNEDNIRNELENAYEVLAEPIQSIMRRFNVPNAYEQLKELTRTEAFQTGSATEKHIALHRFIDQLDIPEEGKELLLALEPTTYVGIAEAIAYL